MDLTGTFDRAVSTVQTSQLAKAAQAKAQSTDAARKTAVDFEAFFISTAMESMFSGIDTDGLFGGGHGERVFRSMMLQEVGKSIAEKSSIGIADAVQREIISLQEVQKK